MKLSNNLKLMPSDVVSGQWSVPATRQGKPILGEPMYSADHACEFNGKVGFGFKRGVMFGQYCFDITIYGVCEKCTFTKQIARNAW